MHLRRFALLFMALLLLLTTACEKEDVNQPKGPGVVIGQGYGLCQGNCTALFLVTEDAVYADDGVDRYAAPTSTWRFRNTPLGTADQLLIDSVLTRIPAAIDDLPREAFGCPDCGDWGALPLAIVDADGEYQEQYTLDNRTRGMAEELQAYGELMRRAVAAWRE